MSLDTTHFGQNSTLAADILPSDTVINLPYGDGAKYQPLAAGKYFYLTIRSGTRREVVKVTSIVGDTLYVTRGQDGTTPQAFPVDACVNFEWNPKQLCEFTQRCTGQIPTPIIDPGTYCFDCNTCITINGYGQITAINGEIKC